MTRQEKGSIIDRRYEVLKTRGPKWFVLGLRKIRLQLRNGINSLYTQLGLILTNRIKMRRNRRKPQRYLEIGPGNERIPEFETLNIIGGPNVDYVLDAAKPLPFKGNTFNVIYASHVLEHIPWYETEEVLEHWVRILKSGGHLEVWVPDGLKICKFLIEFEKDSTKTVPDDWSVLNPRKDPFIWVNGRLMYGARSDYPSVHRAIFTPRYLKELFERTGLINVREMDRSEIRGEDHGWINLGVKGTKP